MVPDDHLAFLVKPRDDPSGKLVKNEYSTSLRVSASGVSVCLQKGANEDDYEEKFFWCYTDFFKWSLVHHQGKMSLQVRLRASLALTLSRALSLSLSLSLARACIVSISRCFLVSVAHRACRVHRFQCS